MNTKVSMVDGYNATNTIDGLKYYDLVSATCKNIYNVLVSHCGPYATDALIVIDNNKNLKDRHHAIFTKDGINIIKSIEFVSPIQQHIQNLIVYIGQRVDSLSHDGTTTSMMFFTKIVELCMRKIINDIGMSVDTDRRSMKNDISQAITELTTTLESNVITVNKIAEDFAINRVDALRFVAYHQAMLSSKGDIELTNALVEVVETLPVELYGLYSISQSGIESEKRFTVLYDDYNFMLPVQTNVDDMNHKMGTEYLSECCDLIVSEDDLKSGNPALEILMDHISSIRSEAFPVAYECIGKYPNSGFWIQKEGSKEPELGECIFISIDGMPLGDGTWVYNGPNRDLTRPEPRNDLVIITKSIDSNILSEIVRINRRSKYKIVVFTMSVPNPYSSKCTILSALLNVAGVYHISEHLEDRSRPYLIQDAKIHYHNRRLYVSNLYEKDGTNYHPFHNNPTAFEPYTKMVKDIKEALDGFTSGRLRFESAMDRARYMDYIEIYRRMICSEVRQLQISGMTHDVLADNDVLQDSFGAVLSSLESGFILDGYLKLSNGIRPHKDDITPLWYPIVEEVLTSILSATHRISIDEIRTKLSEIPEENISPYLFYPVGRGITDLTDYKIYQDDISRILDEQNNHVAIVMQPADTYRELFRRLSDLLPKLINTNRAIIPNTVNEGTSS